MTLSEDEIAAIRAGWAPVFASRDLAAGLFYGRLFQVSPESRALFTGDPTRQGRKLTETLAYVIDHLDRPEALLGPAQDLARRHVAYGVRPDDYAAVGEALLWMLERLLADALTPAARLAWVAAYRELSRMMIAAAYPSVGEARPGDVAAAGRRAPDTES